MTQPKLRLHPYKILALLLYGDYEFVTWDGPVATIKLGALSRLLRVSAERMKEHLGWLTERGYFVASSFQPGVAFVEVRMPPSRGDTSPTLAEAVRAHEKNRLIVFDARRPEAGSWSALQSSPDTSYPEKDESVVVPVDSPSDLW